MTVCELVAILQTYDQDLRVVVDGYEGGYADVTSDKIYKLELTLNVHAPDSYCGPHEDRGVYEYEEHQHEDAIVISRTKDWR